MTVHETERLLLRPSKLTDASALFAFLGDAEAMQHTNCDASLRFCRRRIAVHERQRRRSGYAPWTIVAKEDRRIIGWGGLYDDPFDRGWGVEVGYWVHPQCWGRGYATELVRASLAFAADVLGLDEVRAFAKPQNTASRRVLEKAGFQPVEFVPKLERLLFCRRLGSRRMLG